jgi:hypothetical protein
LAARCLGLRSKQTNRPQIKEVYTKVTNKRPLICRSETVLNLAPKGAVDIVRLFVTNNDVEL